MKKKQQRKATIQILAVRKGNRLAEREILGDGFHCRTRIKKSKKVYSRKNKHKGNELQ